MSEVGLRPTAGVGTKPVPARATLWGELLALSAMLIAAAREPAALGEKVTVITQKELIARGVVMEQVLV